MIEAHDVADGEEETEVERLVMLVDIFNLRIGLEVLEVSQLGVDLLFLLHDLI